MDETLTRSATTGASALTPSCEIIRARRCGRASENISRPARLGFDPRRKMIGDKLRSAGMLPVSSRRHVYM
jgi:hypothetical protein